MAQSGSRGSQLCSSDYFLLTPYAFHRFDGYDAQIFLSCKIRFDLFESFISFGSKPTTHESSAKLDYNQKVPGSKVLVSGGRQLNTATEWRNKFQG